MRVQPVPEKYCGQPVPAAIKKVWRDWDGARWRRQAYFATNRLDPPDERYNIAPPYERLCVTCLDTWIGYRNMHFDPVSGNRWPGGPGSPFDPVGDLKRVLVERRVEWDEKACAQMQLIEKICRANQHPPCAEKWS